MNKDYSLIPKELQELNQWVCTWNTSKIPMRADAKVSASASNPATWNSFEQATYMVDNDYYDHIGFVFNNNGIVGIDIDVGFENGLMTPLCADIVTKCKSYTEYSKSRRGVHIFVRGTLPFDGKNNRKGVEIYQTGRFFVTTGQKMIYSDIIDNQEAIDYIVDKYFSDNERDKASQGSYNGRQYCPKYNKPCDGKIPLRPTYPKVTEGGRNYALCSLAGQLFNQGYSYDVVLNELRHANEIALEPSLSDGEVKSVCDSIYKYYK